MENVQRDTVTSEVGPWAMVPIWVLTYLNGSAVAVYVALRSFADQNGAAHPRVKTIAERAGVSERTVARAITEMRELNLLRTLQWARPDGSIGGCHYYLRDLPPSDVSPPPLTQLSPPPDTAVTTPPDTAVTTPLTQLSEQEHTKEHTSKNTPTTQGPPTLADRARGLADVVVGGCGPIGRSITRKTLDEACAPLAAQGWTPKDLKRAVDGRTWNDCRAGAVITWLRGLTSCPPVRSIGDPRSAQGFAPPCPVHPSEPAGHCTKCASEAVQAPMNWRDVAVSP